MKKSLALLAGAGLMFLGLPNVSHAQAAPAASGPFADVPADHWAYQSVDTLQKKGIVIGYPDGTYGGKRAMTRYEFAVAIARLIPLIPDTSDLASKEDVAKLRSDVEARLGTDEAAIQALQALVAEFRTELTVLGVRVTAVENRLSMLEGRVSAVEAEQQRVKINGDLNFIARGDSTRHRDSNGNFVPFTDQNGVPAAAAASQYGNNHILGSSDVYHDFLLSIRGKLSDTATANVKIDFGNYLSSIGNLVTFNGYPAGGRGGSSSFSEGNRIAGTLNAGNEFTTIYQAYLDAPVSLGPLGGAEAIVGRFGNQLTKWTLMEPDADVYTKLTQTDSGDIPTDGAKLNLKFGPAKVQAFAGKFSAIPYFQPYGGSTGAGFGQIGGRPKGEIFQNHADALQQGAGARATFGSPDSATVGVTVEQFGMANGSTDPENGRFYDRLSVYGADFNGALPFLKNYGLTLDAAYTVSAHGFQSGFNNAGGSGKGSFRYSSHEEQLGFVLAGVLIKGGYEYIGPQFSAPGYWGRVGAWTNPTNVKGPVISAKYAISPKLSLNADAQFYKAAYGTTRDNGGVVINSPLQQNDHLTRYQVGLGYGLSSAYGVDLGYESVRYDLRNNNGTLNQAGKPTEQYITLGLGHSFNNNASLKLLYQIVSYKDKGTGFNNFNNVAGGGDEYGQAAVGQFSLKF